MEPFLSGGGKGGRLVGGPELEGGGGRGLEEIVSALVPWDSTNRLVLSFLNCTVMASTPLQWVVLKVGSEHPPMIINQIKSNQIKSNQIKSNQINYVVGSWLSPLSCCLAGSRTFR